MANVRHSTIDHSTAAGVPRIAGDLGGTAATPQVTATHLAAPLPQVQGGSGSVTLGDGQITATGSTTARAIKDIAADADRSYAPGTVSRNPLVIQSIPFDGLGPSAVPAGVTYSRTGSVYVPAGQVQALCNANELPITEFGLLVERGWSNLLDAASIENFAHAAWVKGNSGSSDPVTTANVYAAPSFRQTATLVEFGATAAAGNYSTICQDFTVVTGTYYTLEVWARRYGSGNRVWIMLWDGGTTAYSGWADINTGLWRRVTVTANLTPGTWKACIGPDARAFTGQTIVQAAAATHLWGAQVARVGGAGINSYPHSLTTDGAGVGDPTISWVNPLPGGSTDWAVGATFTPIGNVGATGLPSGGRTWSLVDSYLVASGTIAAANSWSLRAFTDGAIYFDTYDSGGTLKRVKATHGFAAASSHDIVATNSGGTLSLYFDGVKATTTGSGAGTGVITTQPATIVIPNTGYTGFAIKSWRACRTADGTKCGLAPHRVVAIGDSITHGASNASSITDLQLATPWPIAYGQITGKLANNQGWSGDATSSMLTRWASLRGQHEQAVAVLGGTNDILADLTGAAAFTNLQTIYDQAMADGQTVIAITVPPLSASAGWTPARASQLAALNALIVGYCDTHRTQMVCADANRALGNGSGALFPAYDAGDGIHLTQGGANRLAALVAAAYP